jgi:hypothetical protein
MKKLSLIIAACAMLFAGTSADAQILKNILKSSKSAASDVITSAVSAATGTDVSGTVTLPGTWTYTGVAVGLSSDNTLANVAGSAVSSDAESTMNTQLAKVGIKAGSMTFVFNSDNSFTCTLKKIPTNGTYSLSSDGKTLTMKFGKTMQYLSMTGTLSSTSTGCKVLFDATTAWSFFKKILAVAGSKSSAASTISSLSNTYSGMKMGWALKK